MPEKIPYTRPSITDLEVEYAADAARHGWGPACYEYISRFEQAFQDHLGVKHAVATSSCTGALHMGMAALGIGPGDEVILADTNWIATVSPIVHLGATPVFVDILSDSWCLDPRSVEAAITPRTKAIVAVHLYGNLAEIDALDALAEKYNLALIEDAAEAIGAEYKGKRAGSMGTFGAFSFHGTKTLTTGEGGMFVSSDSELFERVLTLSNHGRTQTQTRQFWPDMVGYKYKMSNIQAAIGCAQMERIDALCTRKQEILAYYRAALSDYSSVSINVEPSHTINGAWMPTIVASPDSGITREHMQSAFEQADIDARVFFHPLTSLPMFTAKPENRNAWDIPTRAINLPSYHDMTSADQDRVVAVIESLL